MSRTISSGALTQLQEHETHMAFLVAIDFHVSEGGPVYLTSAPGDLVYSGNSYSGVGGLISISDIEESSSLSINKVTVSLSGVMSTYITILLGRNFRDRDLTIYLAYLTVNLAIAGDPIKIFQGPMNDVSIIENPGDTCTVSVTASNKFANFEAPRGRHMSDEEQQALFPGDRGFEFCGVQNLEYVWGPSHV